MYSIVLATMLTTGTAAPDHWFHGCRGCCGGNAFSYGCCGGCHGCWGGCYGCYGCCGGYSYGCCGGWGYSQAYYGCCGGCCGYYVPTYSYGCCGGVIVAPEAVEKKKGMEKLPEATEEGGEETQSATVVIKAPLDVKVRFNGQLTRRVSVDQRFKTPILTPGRAYSYEIEAETIQNGQVVTKTEKILVKAGTVARVDFSKMAAAKPAGEKANITVHLPAEAKLFVDGVACPLTSATRSFETPNLVPGRTYFYNLKIEVVRDGETMTDSRHVKMQAGQEVVVDFKNTPVGEQAAKR